MIKYKYILIALFVISIVVSLIQVTYYHKQNKVVSSKPPSKEMLHIISGLEQDNKPGIYILEIFGAIHYNDNSSSLLLESEKGVKSWIKTINECAENPSIKGLLLRINSPGGTIAASQELYNSLVRFKQKKKKLVVSVIDVCASGSYYAALPADKIVANPGSLIGSIGVIMSGLDFSKLLEKYGIKANVIKAGKYKDAMSPYRSLEIAEKAQFQKLADEMYQQFVEEVIKWRGKFSSEKVIRSSATGMVFTARDSKRRGLIDEIGDYEDAKKVLAKLCDLDYNKLHIKNPKTSIKFFQNFLNLKNIWQMFFRADKVQAPLKYEYRY